MKSKGSRNPEIRQSYKQADGQQLRQTGSKEFDLAEYQAALLDQLTEVQHSKFHSDSQGIGNLEYVIARDDEDLARDRVPSLLMSPEERAYQLLNALRPWLFHGYEQLTSSLRLFLKHTLQSLLGRHCVFGVQYQGFEIEEQSFVVHVDNDNRVVMLACTYLPRLPELLTDKKSEEIRLVSLKDIQAEEKRIRNEVSNIGQFERVDTEKLWLNIWNESRSEYEIVPGNQIKLSSPKRRPKSKGRYTLARIPTKPDISPVLLSTNSPRLADGKVGLGEIVRDFVDKENSNLEILDDLHIKKYQAILQDLESGAELRGKYASIKDEIDTGIKNKRGIFVRETDSRIDRVTAYYHLDYIQRYFREKLGFQLLDRYAHLNPVQMILSGDTNISNGIAWYDVNGEKIVVTELASKSFTAVRDPRIIYHEFVHVVTDAIARLPRAGNLIHPRSKEALQAQAMDEGLGDYFAASLARRHGARRAVAYYVVGGKWAVKRDLNPKQNGVKPPRPIEIRKLDKLSDWRKKKYELGEHWGRYLWKIQKSLGADVADILIAYSIFFLTRWATFQQGIQAILLADRLLFGGMHQPEIEKPKEAIEKIIFSGIPSMQAELNPAMELKKSA